MAATQTEIIAERRKEKKRAEARGEGDMVEGYDPVVPPPPNVAPPLPPEAEGYDPVVDPPRPVYKGFKAPPGMTADQRQRWQQSVDTRLSGKEDRALDRGKQDTEDLLRGIGAQAGKVYGDLDEMATKALQYPVKFARDPMGESEKLSGTAIEMGKGLAQTAAAPLELSADITAGRTTPRAVEKQASDVAKRYARALSSGDIEETTKAIEELSAATSLADPTPASELVYAGSQFIDGNVADGMASLLAIVALGGAGAYSIQEAKKAVKKGMTYKGVDAASAEKVADKAVEKAWLMRREGYEPPLSAEEARRKADTMSFAQQEADAAYGQRMTEAKAARQAELDRLEADALAQYEAREAAKVADEQAKVAAAKAEEKAQVDKQLYDEKQRELEAQRKAQRKAQIEAEDVSDEPTVSVPSSSVQSDRMRKQKIQLAQDRRRRERVIRRAKLERAAKKKELAAQADAPKPDAPAPKPKAEAPKAEAPEAPEAPKAEKAPTSEAPDLSKKTIKQLKEYAKSEGISLGSARRKADILRRIEEGSDAGSAIAKARKEAQQPPKAKKAKKADPEPDPAGKPPGGGGRFVLREDAKAMALENLPEGWLKDAIESDGFIPDHLVEDLNKSPSMVQTRNMSPDDIRFDYEFIQKTFAKEASFGPGGAKLTEQEKQMLRRRIAKNTEYLKKNPSGYDKRTGDGSIDYSRTNDDSLMIEQARDIDQELLDNDTRFYDGMLMIKPKSRGGTPGGRESGPAPKTRKVKVRTTGRDAPDDIQRSGDVSETATFVETEPVRGARTSVPLNIKPSTLTKSMSRYIEPRNRTEFPTLGATTDHATNLADKLEGVPPSAIRRQFDQIRSDMGVSRIGEGTGPTKAVVGGKKTALSGPQEVLSKTGELSRRRGVKTKARVAERDLVAVETAYNEMADSARLVKKSQSELDDVMKTAGEMGISSEQYMQPHIRLLEEYEASVKKYEELSGAFAKRFL